MHDIKRTEYIELLIPPPPPNRPFSMIVTIIINSKSSFGTRSEYELFDHLLFYLGFASSLTCVYNYSDILFSGAMVINRSDRFPVSSNYPNSVFTN